MKSASQKWSPPFTKEILLAIINEKAFKTDARIDPTHEKLETLAWLLNGHSRFHIFNVGKFAKHRALVHQVGTAIDLLADKLPELIEHAEGSGNYFLLVDEELALAEGFPARDWANERRWVLKNNTKGGRAELQALKQLHSHALTAKKLGVPCSKYLSSPDLQKWEGIARQLFKEFEDIFPGRKKASIYRYLEGVIPFITKETPTFEAIQTYFKRKRPISKRRRYKG